MADQRTQQILSQVNRRLPPGVNWKAGALNYLDQLFTGENHEEMRRFHLTKPFKTFQDNSSSIRLQTQEFSREISFFAYILSVLELPISSSFLDVACGTGWVSHYLGKLGFRVCGFDISPAMIDLAKERVAADPWPTTNGELLNINFFVHDIEESPLTTTEKFDVAILESALHHFVDPIKTLQNIRHNLADDGLVVIIEGSSDGTDDYCREIMERFNTLERPYTTSELDEIVDCAGFSFRRRVVPLSGFFYPGLISSMSVENLLCQDCGWNTLIAGQSENSLNAIRLQGSEEPTSFFVNASGDVVVDIECEQWIAATSKLRLSMPGYSAAELIFRTPIPNMVSRVTRFIVVDKTRFDNRHVFSISPSAYGEAELRLLLPLTNGLGDFELISSQTFSPSWFDNGYGDSRLLSGRLQVHPSLRSTNELGEFSELDVVLMNDCWMGPNVEFAPRVGLEGKVGLEFVSPLPRKRLRSQTIWVSLNSTGECHNVVLKPHVKNLESMATLVLEGLAPGEILNLHTTDAFKPSSDSGGDQRLLSYRLTQKFSG